VECKVADPNNKNGEVDGENPYHENENGMTVVVKVVCKVGALVERQNQDLSRLFGYDLRFPREGAERVCMSQSGRCRGRRRQIGMEEQ
jgi:hypothetical protein